MSVLAESFTPYSKNKASSFFSGPSPQASTDHNLTDGSLTIFSGLGLDLIDDEFSMNDVQSKANENNQKALEVALDRIKLLESELYQANTEKSTYAKNLKETSEQCADLESSLNRLQVEFDQYKATTVSALEAKNEALQLDMERLAEKLIDEAERRSELEHAKQVLEAELEDLSQNLFEEANKMVSDERRINKEWEEKHNKLESKLTDLKSLLDSEKEQSTELKGRLEELIEERDASGTHDSDEHTSSFSTRHGRSHSISTISPTRSVHSSDSGYRGAITLSSRDMCSSGSNTLSFHSNDHRFQEFKEFLEAPKSKGLYLSSKFMKRALNEDVDPALRFDSSLLTGWMTQKRLLTAAQVGNINIYPFKGDSEVILPSQQCAFCSTNKGKALQYQYSISGGESEPHMICYQCRDRLLSVCKFFALLRMTRAGVIKATPQKLYLDCLQAKHSMFLSRVGAEVAAAEETADSLGEEVDTVLTSESTSPLAPVTHALGPPLPGSIVDEQ